MAKTDPKLALATLIEQANGRRRNFLMTLDDALAAAREALEAQHGIAVRHGGGGRVLGRTTLCLAVAERGKVVVGVATGWADNPSPGRVWKEVGPWQQDFARNVEKARAWAKAKAADRISFTEAELGGAPKKKTEVDGGDLLAAVLANPDDDAARLVYADFLSQSGDARGELIAVQCALVTAPKAQRTALLEREKELLKANAKKWSQHASQVALECHFVRGFVGAIKAKAVAFTHHGAKLFETDPLEEVILSSPNAAGLDLLAQAEHLGRLRKLQFSSPYWVQREKDVLALGRFLSSAPVKKLRALDLTIDVAPAVSFGEIFSSLSLPALEELTLALISGAELAEGYEALARAKLPKLRALKVHTRRAVTRKALSAAFPEAKLT